MLVILLSLRLIKKKIIISNIIIIMTIILVTQIMEKLILYQLTLTAIIMYFKIIIAQWHTLNLIVIIMGALEITTMEVYQKIIVHI